MYLFGLDRRELLRMGGAARGHHLSDDGKIVWSRRFDSDHQWLPLVWLLDCRIGAVMRARVRVDAREHPLRTTLVQHLDQIRPQPDPS